MPYYNGDPERDHIFDNHPYFHTYLGSCRIFGVHRHPVRAALLLSPATNADRDSVNWVAIKKVQLNCDKEAKLVGMYPNLQFLNFLYGPCLNETSIHFSISFSVMVP